MARFESTSAKKHLGASGLILAGWGQANRPAMTGWASRQRVHHAEVFIPAVMTRTPRGNAGGRNAHTKRVPTGVGRGIE